MITGTTPAARSHSGSVVVAAAPLAVYAVVSDVTRTGEWSPVVTACWWDQPPGEAGPRPGDVFTGRNETPARTWETRCTVEVAEPGRRFGWLVGDGLVRWRYDLEPVDDLPDGAAGPGGGPATRLTETWEFLEAGIARFEERWGESAQEQVEERTAAALTGIPVTLAAIRRVVEASGGVRAS